MNVWQNCGHPKTPANTQRIGKAGDRCRECRRKIAREHWRRKFKFYEKPKCDEPSANVLDS